MKSTRSQVASSKRQRLVDNKKLSKKKKVTKKKPTKNDSRKDASLPNTKPEISRKKEKVGDSVNQASPVDVSTLKSPPSDIVSNKAASDPRIDSNENPSPISSTKHHLWEKMYNPLYNPKSQIKH